MANIPHRLTIDAPPERVHQSSLVSSDLCDGDRSCVTQRLRVCAQ